MTTTLEFSFDGAPLCRIAVVNTVPQAMEHTPTGAPIWFKSLSVPILLGHIKSINGVAWEHVAKYNQVANSHINKALGVEG